MFKLLSFASLALAALSLVSGLPIPRQSAPATYANGYLEDYETYHQRYLALDCEAQHNTPFFDSCCHPMLATETLATARAPECNPANAASTSPASAAPVPTDGANGGEDAPTSSADPAAANPEGPPPTTTDAPAPTSSADPAAANPEGPPPTTTDAPAPPPSTTPEPSPTTSEAPAAPSPTDSGNSGDPSLITGGVGTFFYQNGVAGACGTVHSDSDSVCAMDSARYGNGELCGKTVQITRVSTGVTAQCVVADECPTCDNANSIDMSVGMFTQFADESVGEFDIAWAFV